MEKKGGEICLVTKGVTESCQRKKLPKITERRGKNIILITEENVNGRGDDAE